MHSLGKVTNILYVYLIFDKCAKVSCSISGKSISPIFLLYIFWEKQYHWHWSVGLFPLIPTQWPYKFRRITEINHEMMHLHTCHAWAPIDRKFQRILNLRNFWYRKYLSRRTWISGKKLWANQHLKRHFNATFHQSQKKHCQRQNGPRHWLL